MFSFFPPKIGSTNSVKFSLYFSIYAPCFILILQRCLIVHSIFPSFSSSSSVFCCASDNSCAFVKSIQLSQVLLQLTQFFFKFGNCIFNRFPFTPPLYESLRLRCCFGASSTTFSLLNFRFLHKFSRFFHF